MPIPEVAVVADACLITSHRLTQWVSNAPTMEEDVAIGNIALDLLGQARGLLSQLGDEDQLAYFRPAAEFRHPVICELPNGDFGHTMLRQHFLDCWLSIVWRSFVTHEDEIVRGVAEKALKENAYHRRHSSAWVVRLGDGTEESHRRMTAALDDLWSYCAPLALDGWYDAVTGVLADATLTVPAAPARRDDDASSTRADLIELLDDMQSLARAHPGASW
jgi:ring-1,2-phenylacetyl-CoA epoxidase subunit PaaC